jgi:hypothetical protein
MGMICHEEISVWLHSNALRTGHLCTQASLIFYEASIGAPTLVAACAISFPPLSSLPMRGLWDFFGNLVELSVHE